MHAPFPAVIFASFVPWHSCYHTTARPPVIPKVDVYIRRIGQPFNPNISGSDNRSLTLRIADYVVYGPKTQE